MLRGTVVAIAMVTAAGCVLDRSGSAPDGSGGDAGASQTASTSTTSTAGPGGGGAGGTAGSGTASSSSVGGSGGTGGGPGGEGPGCPTGLPGPSMVRVEHADGDFCIDSTEVTSAHYEGFLDSNPTLPSTSECAWKTDFTPRQSGEQCAPMHYDPDNLPNRPVACVDWCDAKAYCAWAGKRLCGNPGGGAASYTTPGNAAASEWFAACSRGGQQLYPYGSAYVATACVDDAYDGQVGDGPDDEAVDVGTVSSCEGGYAEIFDLSGNVWEWENACNAQGNPQDDHCYTRGGSFWDDNALYLDCPNPGPGNHTRAFYNKNIGFRCCAAAPEDDDGG